MNIYASTCKCQILVVQMVFLICSLCCYSPVSCFSVVLFSAIGENAQEEIAVGIGALAGSTIMILSLPWFLSIYAGRVNIRPDGTLNYKRPRNASRSTWRKLDPQGNASLRGTGVGVNPMVSVTGRILLFTSLSYVVIQGAALLSGVVFKDMQTSALTKLAAQRERGFALGCSMFSFVLFVWYLWYQVTASREESDYRDSVVEAVTQRAIRSGRISLSAAFFSELSQLATVASESTDLLQRNHAENRFRGLLRTFFYHYDYNGDGSIDVSELQYVMRDLGEKLNPEEIQSCMDDMDLDNSGTIDFEEFSAAIPRFIKKRAFQIDNVSALNGFVADTEAQIEKDAGNAQLDGTQDAEDDYEEEEEVPEDLQHKDPQVQIRRVMIRSFQMMFLGTFLVILFSDPMVDVLTDIGRRLGISSFYISFIFAPMASNASEILASVRYASKKTHKSVTISFATLLGAAVMNNTFVVSLFLILVATQSLAWQFSAETLSILLVEFIMVYLSQKKVQTLLDGYVALSLLPLSLLLVAFLEGVIGLD